MSQPATAIRGAVSRLLRYEKIRFAAVGIVNTLVDFAVLLSLTIFAGVPALWANIASTSCALIVSYLLNKKAVFGDTDTHNVRQIVLFVAVTLSGIWLVQSVIIVSVTQWLHTAVMGVVHDTWLLVAAKLIATVVSLVWNYVWYSTVVFRKKKHES